MSTDSTPFPRDKEPGLPLDDRQGHQAKAVVLDSTLTCPFCGHRKAEVMPTDACQWFYECEHCHAVLRPKAGDCCVFCSYGSVPCPPVQRAAGSACCARAPPEGDAPG